MKRWLKWALVAYAAWAIFRVLRFHANAPGATWQQSIRYGVPFLGGLVPDGGPGTSEGRERTRG